MPNPYIGWVNLQMVSTRHHLSLLVEEKTANHRIRNRGVIESAAWHLKRGYHCYLFELGANYQLSAPESCTCADDLCRALRSIDKHPGEASELLDLENRGWVADLLSAVSAAEVGLLPAKAHDAGGLQLVDLDKSSVSLSAEAVTNWLSLFKELVDRQREVMIEC